MLANLKIYVARALLVIAASAAMAGAVGSASASADPAVDPGQTYRSMDECPADMHWVIDHCE